MIDPMEQMRIKVISVRLKGRQYRAYIRANAPNVEIALVIHFRADASARSPDIWCRARDEALRYLDIA